MTALERVTPETISPGFMIVPSMACQAGCRYCFGPHAGAVMDERTAEETVRFVHSAARECDLGAISVVFHGGEPLLAPISVWKTLLDGLRRSPDGIPVEFSVQSNLWKLDDEFLRLFEEYNVSIGTSLDGPEPICDENRGAGYYARTMAGIARAEAAGQRVGAIATLTRQSRVRAREILAFFRDRGINPVLHAAVPGMDAGPDAFSLTADDYAETVIGLYPWYVRNRKYFSVPTLDHYCSAVVRGDPCVCTMQDCLGMFLVISPTGDITSCQRLSGRPEFTLGSVFDRPSVDALRESPAWKRLERRQREVDVRCAGCEWLAICRGGCWYNALSAGDGVVDPLCIAYRRIYAFLRGRITEEIGAEENAAAIRRRPPRKDENPLARSGPYISLADRMHPSEVAENARRILGAYALGRDPTLDAAAQAMVDAHFSADRESTRAALAAMRRELERERTSFNNCYIHTTFRCNLRCSHCYAEAGDRGEEMPVPAMARVAEEAIGLRFRQLVITGGEPLFHADRAGLIALCRRLRGRGSNLVLRTNLTGQFTDAELRAVAAAFDQVVVSVDGSEETHDARRGKGSYRSAVTNCERYAELTRGDPGAGELSLACVMCAADINGAPGRSVRALGDRLGVRRVRFRPLLPLGRAAASDEPPFSECINQHEPIEDVLRTPFQPMRSCGIGQNVYICPDGRAYPCYAWQTEASYLGNVLDSGLAAVLAEPKFTRLRDCTVDTIEKCRDCELRYLCGGACRAWGNREETDPNTAPPTCEHLQKRARELIAAAEGYLREP